MGQTELRREMTRNQYTEEELQKKETLYLRTMAARKSIHESYLQQKGKTAQAEEKMRQRDNDWQEMLKVIEVRDSEIRQYQLDLSRANQRIDELEQQKKKCMDAFKKETGKTFNMLLEQFKVEPSSPPVDAATFKGFCY